MSWVTPRTWVTAEVVTAAHLNEQIRDNLNFLYTSPTCRVYNSAAISLTNATVTYLTFNSERWDTDTMHDTSTNTGRITMTTAGKYLVGANIEFADNSTGTRQVRIRHQGATVFAQDGRNATTAGGAGSMVSMASPWSFTATQYAEVAGFQNSGGALNVPANSAYSPEFWAHFIGN